MTAGSHRPEQAPGAPLYASESASAPEVGASRRSEPGNGPQAGAQGFEPWSQLEAPAHDAGPTIAEAAAVDRNWDVERAGEA